MSLLLSEKNNYVKITKLFFDSRERESGSVTQYGLRLPVKIPNVIGVSLRSYSFPESVLPSFTRDTSDAFDFQLTNDSDYSATFTVIWEPKSFEYSDTSTVDYCFTLKQMLKKAVFNHSVFGYGQATEVNFDVIATPYEYTTITFFGTGVVEMKLLFASGPSAHRSAYIQMGFDKMDYTSSNETLVSPNPVNLRAFSSVDLFVKEFTGNNVFGRVYLTTHSTDVAENTFQRVSFFETPIRLLQFLNVHIENNGKPIEDIQENEHHWSVTVYSLAENMEVPKWLLQHFVC